MLLAAADRLFGGGEPAPAPSRHWLLRYLAVTALLAAILVARRPDAVTTPQFWGEDGYIFFFENLTLGFPRALATMYQGFPYLAARLIAFAGGLVPFTLAPRVYTTSAIALTALGLAIFVLPAFRHIVRSDALRVLFGVLVVCAPMGREVLSNPTNLGWFLAISLALLSLARLPPAPWRVALVSAGGAVLVCSTPLAPINLPLWLLRGWRGLRRGDRGDVALALVLVATVVLLLMLTRGLGSTPGPTFGTDQFTPLTHPALFLRNALGMMSHRTAAFFLPPGAAVLLGPPGAAAITLLLLATLVALCAAGSFRTLSALLTALYLFGAYFLALLLGRPQIFLFLRAWELLPSRYLIFPGAMLALAVVTAVDAAPAGRRRRVMAAGIAALCVWAWSSRFVVQPLADLDWPRWASELARKQASGSHAELRIPMNPPWAPLVFDRLGVPLDTPVAPVVILAGLGTTGTFRQLFRSGCAGLAAVDVFLAAGAWSAEGVVRLRLFAGRSLVAEQELPRAAIQPSGSWQRLYFQPIPDSAGKDYTIAVQAVGNVLDATVYILGARGDPYPHGAAVLGGTPVDGDAAFRYACPPATAGSRDQEIVPQASGLRRR